MGYKYKKGFPGIYSLPIYSHENILILSSLGQGYKLLDIGCGEGKFYNQVLKATGLDIEYVGLDRDPSLKGTVDFPLYANVKELKKAGYKHRHFDGLLMMNLAEHLSFEDLYNLLVEVNPYIDGDIMILTPNSRCLDFLHNDPEHVAFYPHDVLYGLISHLGYTFVELWRGGGIHMIRQKHAAANPQDPLAQEGLKLNELQVNVCKAMGLDWFANILAIGDRREIEKDTTD